MLLQKTDKARNELRPGMRTLGLLERRMLLLANGSKALVDFGPMFDGQGSQIALGLVSQGYLEVVKPGAAGGAPALDEAQDVTLPAPLAAAPAPSPLAPPAATAQAELPPASAADSFNGKRSLATTRMFLFDICERMFARRDAALAEQFREALRNAKDRDSMLSAGREMITEIERVAGHERADSISERIAMLMPPEAAHA